MITIMLLFIVAVVVAIVIIVITSYSGIDFCCISASDVGRRIF